MKLTWEQIEAQDNLRRTLADRTKWPQLGPSQTCVECGAPLSNAQSQRRGYGDHCARKVLERTYGAPPKRASSYLRPHVR